MVQGDTLCTSKRQCRLEINPNSLLFVSGFLTRMLQSSLTPKTTVAIVATVAVEDSDGFRTSVEFSNFSSCSATNGIRGMATACWFVADAKLSDIETSRACESPESE